MARTKGSGFKMKRGPIKDLGSFISGIFGKEAVESRREKQREGNKGTKYEGMTHFEKMWAKRKEARIPEWKRKHDARKQAKTSESKKEGIKVDWENFLGNEPIKEEEPKGYVPQEFKGEAGDKFRYRKTGEYTEGDDTYSKFEFMDPNRPGEWIPAGKTKEGGWKGFNKIASLYEERLAADELFDSPVEKKSPYKKGIGKYTKKAKGNRGYKMKRK